MSGRIHQSFVYFSLFEGNIRAGGKYGEISWKVRGEAKHNHMNELVDSPDSKIDWQFEINEHHPWCG